ncbi:MAG: PepSY-associated TM helix domain-containing protein, partial [Candidatus Sericytochromatia bacterium]
MPIRLSPQFRLRFRQAHMIVGLTAGLIVSLTGLTGASVAFRHEIDQALNPALFRAPPAAVEAPVDRIIARAVDGRGSPATMVAFPREAGEAFVVDLADGREVFVDPGGERVLGERIGDEALMAVVLRLHRTLLAGEAGKLVVGGASLALLLLVLSGLVLRAPRRGPARRRTARDWHELLGLWATLTLAISTITGATFAFKAQTVPAIAWLTRSEPVKAPKLPETEPVAMDTAQAVATARRQ